MLTEKARNEVVEELFNVYKTGQQMVRPTESRSGMEIEDAYRIQQAFIQRKVDNGAHIKGYKVGLTSKVMQEMAGSDEPDFSAVTDDMFFPENTEIGSELFFSPMVEMEIALVMKHPLRGPGVMPVDVIRATDFVLPAIEIVDFRVALSEGFNIVDSVADLAACGAVVLGGNPMSLRDIDVRTVHGRLALNGKLHEEGEASAVLGNPVTAVAWLANKLGEFGTGFEPGDTILSGSFVRAVPIKAGDHVVCSFDQGFGDVAFSLRLPSQI
ncbi:MAG: fumarylacetoacetate hydrolase family protein [Haliea sp.]